MGHPDVFIGKYDCGSGVRRVDVHVVSGILKAVRLAMADTHMFAISALGLQTNILFPNDCDSGDNSSSNSSSDIGDEWENGHVTVSDVDGSDSNSNPHPHPVTVDSCCGNGVEVEVEVEVVKWWDGDSEDEDEEWECWRPNTTSNTTSVMSLKHLCEEAIISPRTNTHTLHPSPSPSTSASICVSLITVTNVLDMIEFGRSYNAGVLLLYCLQFVRM